MSFSIERYKEESRKLDTTGVDWAAVAASPLSKGDLFCLHYMMDIENHVPLYLSHLLVTRACMDPILTAFLACWNYEELWHGENLGKLLNLYGIEFDTQDRIAKVRANLGFQNSVSILSTMVGSWLLKDFSAVYLTIGAINELSTLTIPDRQWQRFGHKMSSISGCFRSFNICRARQDSSRHAPWSRDWSRRSFSPCSSHWPAVSTIGPGTGPGLARPSSRPGHDLRGPASCDRGVASCVLPRRRVTWAGA